ncbi:sigma-70 family RNA polymerase sigma factor [Nocardioides sp. REDSEA-S30_B4]|jgi:RNA polymerase sigma-B factor|uniref:sigma-70 family RNA polymerase sigma factor n=1 Tax=Nocardioides sp. REDSEA-S30_B4 TaxID=1811552 RepID=UPI000A8E7DAE|nr:sigma-70 family RNA polymerase sigma factor [Nocardioides sp. REDSEA-S30_B4]
MTSPSSSTIRRRRTAALLEYAQGLPRGPRRATLRTVVDLNCPVAERIAQRYRRRGLADDDLRQAAYEGLIKAVGRFDPSRADDLLTFAVPTIRGEVQRLFRDESWGVRPPRRLQELSADAHTVTDDLRSELGREPTTLEVASRLGCSDAALREARLASRSMVTRSLDVPGGEEGDGAPGTERLGREDRLDHVENRMVLEPALRTLSGRDREIIRLRFTEELSQGEIGELIGVTQTQVSRLLTRILGHLRGALGDVDLRPLTSGPTPLVGHV